MTRDARPSLFPFLPPKSAAMREQAVEGLEWCEDWGDGRFSPSHTKDGWTVEMYGLVAQYQALAKAYLEATDG